MAMGIMLRVILTVASVVALTSVPFDVKADQISPNPNMSGHTIYVVTDEAYNSLGLFINYGSIENYFTLDNFGGLDNSGTLYNHWSLNNYGTLDNSGTLDNFGWLKNFYGGTLNNNAGGTLNNSFMLENLDTLDNSGTLNNSGMLHNFLWLNNFVGGTLNNNAGGTLYNWAMLDNSGTLNNNHIIEGSGTYTQTAGQTINNGSMSQRSFTFNGGSLSGTGTMNGPVTIGSGATVMPGNSAGTLTINGTFSSSGNFVFEIGGLDAGQYDVLDINGSAFFTGGSFEFDFIDGFTASAGNYWDFLFADSITGWSTLAFNIDGLGAGLGWEISSFAGGQRLSITQSQSVPEPTTILLLGLGLIGLAGFRRKA